MPQADRIMLRSSPSEDTGPEMGMLLGHALAMDHRLVVVGRDMMRTSTMMKEALVAGLLSSGADVLDVGVVSAPVLGMAASRGDCAVYVTEYRGYGMVSGYLLVNPNGSLFRREQIRHLDKYLVEPPELPASGSLGHVLERPDATGEYNAGVLSSNGDGAECTVVLDCCCGPVSFSAPQILNAMGADVLCMNAQNDMGFASGELDGNGIDSEGVRRQVEANPGCVGMAMNKIGSMVSILDERGGELTPEQVFALTVVIRRPRSIAVPIDASSLMEDALRRGGDDTELVFTDISAAAVCDAVAAGAEMGYYGGGVVHGDGSLMPDGIRTAAVIAGMAADNSINHIVDGFPEYLRMESSIECQCTPEAFVHSLEDRLGDIEGRAVARRDAWRVDMDGGWYMLRLVRGLEPQVEVVAESRDKAYLIGLMEIASDLAGQCARPQ